MSAIDDLLHEVFDGARPAFYHEFVAWVRDSRRFRAFAGAYRVKIRAKLKRAGDEGSLQDLRAELEVAALLLREERFALEYEKYAASKRRGPDFTVTFKTHTLFNVEVRRMRSVELDAGDAEALLAKLAAVLIDKAGQTQPSMVNLLWLVAERQIPRADVDAAMTALRQLAERKAEDLFTHRGYASAADFLKHYGQLSAIVVRQPGENEVWLNPLARHKVPREIATAIERLGKT